MNKSVLKKSATLIASVLLASGAAFASPLPTCNVSDVKLTSLSVAGASGSTAVSYSATECVGSYIKNDVPYPQQNLGYYKDGLFNGEPQVATHATLFPNGIFSDQYTAIDLNHDGKVDPGWIRLVSWTPGEGLTVPPIGGITGIQLASWFTFTMSASGNSGTWSFKPDIDVVSRVFPVLGGNLFDQFALSFASGSAFAAYDFVGSALGLPTSSSTIYGFSGTWDMSHTLINNGGQAGALSHVDLYVRDPNGGSHVPEPASLALIGLGLAGLGAIRRRKA